MRPARSFTVVFACLLVLEASAQQAVIQSARPRWDPAWSDTPALISEVLSDSLSIRIRNVKPQFLAVFFERRKVVRFNTAEDIKRYGPVVLPESLDPPYDELGKPWERRETRPYPLLFNLRVDHFAARVIRPDGSWDELPVDTRSAKGILNDPLAYHATMSITHYPIGIMPGDVVEYHWKYMLPWDLNASAARGGRNRSWVDNWQLLTNWRIYFHHGLPIREQRIELRYHAKHGLELAGAAPSILKREENERLAVWENAGLAGCMDESDARQADELPNIIVVLRPDDIRFLRRERLSGLPIVQQPWLQSIRGREVKSEWLRRVSMKRIGDRQNRLVKAFVRETCHGMQDSLRTRCLETIHERIARDFTYQNDRDYYMDIDRGLERMGDQVRDGRLRDISRYNLYCKLINELRLEYCTAYLLDKRSGRLDDRFVSPMRANEWLFGIRDGEGMLWMHPKQQRHGWFANELPFYWEGTAALLIDRQRLLEDDPRPPLFVELPMSEASANVRAIEYALEVDLEKADAMGKARIFLSGQFSTLGRAAFMGGKRDSTVMPAYGHTPALVRGIIARRSGEHDLSSDPPFRYREQQELNLADFRRQEPRSQHAFDLTGFIAHAIPEGFTAEGRDLPFLWDFAHTDRVIIDIAFAQPVEVMDLTQLQGEWSSPSAGYTLEATRIDARHVRIESRLQVLKEREEVEDAEALEALMRAALGAERVLRVRWPSASEGPNAGE